MGTLEQAAIKAPWPGATPAQDAAYAQQVSMGDIEFEQAVVEHSGPVGEDYIDANKANLLDTSRFNVMGTYTREGMSEKGMAAGRKRYAEVLKEAGIKEFAKGEVNVISAENATPDIFAHEFDHRRYDIEGISHILGEEKSIILRQAFRADSPTEWVTAVETWYALNRHKFDGKDKNMYDVEAHLKKMLESWGDSLIESEVEARKGRGDRPMTREGRFFGQREGSLREDAEEQAKQRAKNRNMKAFFDKTKTDTEAGNAIYIR